MKAYSKKEMPKKTVLVGELEHTVDKKSGLIHSKNVILSAEKGKICKSESRTVIDTHNGSIMNVHQSDVECRSMNIKDILDCMKKGMDMFEKSSKKKRRVSKQ